jgi:pimeloyl-ACP methyl ester carboxylesterase
MAARDRPNRRWAIELMRRRPGLLGRVISAGASTTDRTLLAEQEARETAARSFLAATARGAAPMIEDYLVCRAEWGFGPKDVNGRVHLWHGTDDRLIPGSYVEPLARHVAQLPGVVHPDDGHFFFRARIREILAPLPPEEIGNRARFGRTRGLSRASRGARIRTGDLGSPKAAR